jgi:14-3-3 protein epsilon
MQLLRDNLTLWTSDLQEDAGEDQQKGDDAIRPEEAE